MLYLIGKVYCHSKQALPIIWIYPSPCISLSRLTDQNSSNQKYDDVVRKPDFLKASLILDSTLLTVAIQRRGNKVSYCGVKYKVFLFIKDLCDL